MTHLADLLHALQTTEPGSPRITWYVADGGPSDGERIELSGAVLANWASKAANLLQDELAAGPGSLVVLDLPPHWRTLYWALGAWAVGAQVAAAATGADDVVITSDPARCPDGDELVVVTLPALARAATVPVPAGAVDEARELSSHGDHFTAMGRADGSDAALADPPCPFEVAPGTAPRRRLVVLDGTEPTGPWLHAVVTELVSGGSVVVVLAGRDRGRSAERVMRIAMQERAEDVTPLGW